MERGVAALRRDLAEAEVAVEILHGAELEATRLLGMSRTELGRFSLAGSGRYVLLEFPYRGWPVALEAAVSRVVDAGMTPVLGHPERNPEVQDRPGRLEELVGAGAIVQVTAGSLLGWFGTPGQQAAERLLALRLVHLLATDAHGAHIRQGGLAAARDRIAGADVAAYLTEAVPAAIAAGEAVPPFPAPPATAG
jgi:protein-tyrosine phosphatase